MFRELSLAYGWTPAQIEALTTPHLSWYLCAESPAASRWIAPDEARDRAKSRRAARDAWVQTVKEILNRGLPTS